MDNEIREDIVKLEEALEAEWFPQQPHCKYSPVLKIGTLKIGTEREKTKDWNAFLGFLAQGA